MLVHCRVTPSITFAGTHLHTWVERGTVRVKCFAQEHNTMSPARIRTQSACSGVERTNHEATAPPHLWCTETILKDHTSLTVMMSPLQHLALSAFHGGICNMLQPDQGKQHLLLLLLLLLCITGLQSSF